MTELLDILDRLGEADEASIKLDRDLCAREGGYHHFLKEAWHTVEPSELIDERYVEFLCRHTEALMRGQLPSNRLLINIPPGHTKSMTMVVFPTAWLWQIDPTAYSIFAHKDQPLARDMARKTRQCVTSSWYQKRWGDKVTLLDDAHKIDRFGNTAGGGRVAVTVRQQITGAHAKGKFGGLIVIDDPDTPQDTELETERTGRWYRQTLPTRFASLDDSQIGIVQQRISQRDLSSYVLDTDEGYVHVNLPMEFDPDRKCVTPLGEDWRTEPGEILSPLRNTPETIKRLKDVFGDPRVAEAQLNQDPVASDGAIFSEKMFALRYKDPTLAERLPFETKPLILQPKAFPHLWLPKRLEWTLACDLTFTGEKSSDFAVIQSWARCVRTDRHYLDDMVREKMGFIETANRLLALLSGKHKHATPLIEKAANGFAVIEILEKAGIPNVEQFSAGKKSKEARAAAVSWLLDDERVLFPELPRYNLKEYIREMTGFPNMRHDDVVDATTMYLAWVSGDNTPDLANAFRFAGQFAKGIK